jgi:SAM-dependent methyltransferase
MHPSPRLAVRLVNGILAVKPLANAVKHQARAAMIRRAESIGVPWRSRVAEWRSQLDLDCHVTTGSGAALLAEIQHPNLEYPDYYLTSFHAYEWGNLCWEAATEVEVAAYVVHARIWPDAGAQGDAQLRQSYHTVLVEHLNTSPQDVLDIGCSVGMSTFALQDCYPSARLVGLDLSPYFLAIAQLQAQQQQRQVRWVHAAAEATGLPETSFDLVSLCLVCHELPRTAASAIFSEARRLLRPGGHLAIMDMNPHSQVHRQLPPYVLTLLKSTEPYLDDYFSFDISTAIATAGFAPPLVVNNSPRHRTLLASAQ